MVSRSPLRWSLPKLGLFLLVFAVLGCRQSAGDRCQLDSDCDDGLICRYTGLPNPAIGGQCQTPQNAADAAPPDAAIDAAVDAATDAAIDATTDADTDAATDATTD